nr:hypothetical protein [Tanacetum cinerariifolium]
MKSVQTMSLSNTHMKRYDNTESGCESYVPAAHSELPNSILLIVPKPLEKLKPRALLTTHVLLLKLSKLGHSSIDSFQGRRCYLFNNLYWVYSDIPNSIADLLSSLAYSLGIQSERIPRKGQNRIKTEQKQEAWRSREKSEVVTQSGNPTFSLHKEIASLEVTHKIHDSKGCNFLSDELPDIDSFNDIHPHFDDDPLSGSTTYSANSLLEEFTDELALITYPPDYDDNHTCNIESDLREMEFFLYQGKDSDLKDSIDQSDLANLDDLFVDPTPEMFTDEQPHDYTFPPRFDVYPDDFLEIESDADNFDYDLFDFKGEKIKEAELLIDQLDLPCDILLEYDSFNSQDFSRDDDLPSPDNEDKDFDPPFYELLVFKDVPNSMRLLPFSSENEEKVFKPGIYTSEKVKEYQEKDKIGSKPDKNGKHGEARKSQKHLQSVKEEKLKKM